MPAVIGVHPKRIHHLAFGERVGQGRNFVLQRRLEPLTDLLTHFRNELRGETAHDGANRLGIIHQSRGRGLSRFVETCLRHHGESFTMSRGTTLIHHASESRGLRGQFTRIAHTVDAHRFVGAEHGHQILGSEFFRVPGRREVGEGESVLENLHVDHRHGRRWCVTGRATTASATTAGDEDERNRDDSSASRADPAQQFSEERAPAGHDHSHTSARSTASSRRDLVWDLHLYGEKSSPERRGSTVTRGGDRGWPGRLRRRRRSPSVARVSARRRRNDVPPPRVPVLRR